MVNDETKDFDLNKMSEQHFVRAHCCIKKLKKGLIDFLKKPKRIKIVNFPIEMDGSIQSFQRYCVIHSQVLLLARVEFVIIPTLPWMKS